MSLERLYKFTEAPAQEDLCERIELELRTLEMQYGDVEIVSISHDILSTVVGSYVYNALLVVRVNIKDPNAEETN